jgi:superkiller protein 3
MAFGARSRLQEYAICIVLTSIAPTLSPYLWAQALPLQAEQEIRVSIANRQLDRAEALISAQIAVRPKDADLITLIAELRLSQGRPQEARTLAKDAEEAGGPTALRAQLSGLANAALGRLDLAEPQFRRAIQLDAKFAPAHYFLGRLLYNRNRFDEAIEVTKVAIELSPDSVRAYENLGLCFEGKHDLQEAERWYREALRVNATSSSKSEWPALDLATMLIKSGRIAEAHLLLNESLAINPQNAQTRFQMGVLLEKTGEDQAGLEQYRQAIRFDPQLGGAYYRAARICRKLGYQREAQDYFGRFKEITEKKH